MKTSETANRSSWSCPASASLFRHWLNGIIRKRIACA